MLKNQSGQLNLDSVQRMVDINLAAHAVGIAVKIVVAIGQINAVHMRAHLLNLQKLLKVIRVNLGLVGGFTAVQEHEVGSDLLLINCFAAFALGYGLVARGNGFGLAVAFFGAVNVAAHLRIYKLAIVKSALLLDINLNAENEAHFYFRNHFEVQLIALAFLVQVHVANHLAAVHHIVFNRLLLRYGTGSKA